MDDFKVFDFHRIFVGEGPSLYFLEIIFRTAIMYAYTVFLLRLLGKRGMGQLSMLELAIIISFGSAVGDPMIAADMPILYGITAITVVTVIQIAFEHLINKNRKVEAVMEGKSNVVVRDGIINWEQMQQDNISKEDLFRSLREKNVQHLGEVKTVFFETSGAISVFFRAPSSVVPGLSVEPVEMLDESAIIGIHDNVEQNAYYSCFNCGFTVKMDNTLTLHKCEKCGGEKWIRSA